MTGGPSRHLLAGWGFLFRQDSGVPSGCPLVLSTIVRLDFADTCGNVASSFNDGLSVIGRSI